MKQLALMIGVVLASLSLSAQNPTGWSPIEAVDQLVLPAQNNKALRSAELAARRPGRPEQFAARMEVAVRPDQQGTWDHLPSGQSVWRMRLLSAGAYSLNLGFTRFRMPAGGQLFLTSPDRKTVLGPFTPADNEDHLQLWTPIVYGEELVVEVQMPSQRIPELELELKYVHHDYMGFGLAQAASGSCNLDVICGAADGFGIVDDYRDIIQSAGMYTLNGFQTCSGALINNARNDCTPYFLTAEHCGVSGNNAATMVAYWNYQNSTCRQPNTPASGSPGDGTFNEFNSGAILRAKYGPSDFCLVEFDDPLNADHDPFLAGWSRELAVPDTMIGIHHPGTEEKRISFDFDQGTISGWQNPNDSTHVQVNDWDIGTTEGGSSGSPLFNQDKRIVGDLTGGGAACGNNLEDQYGWLRVSWEGGGTPSTRLKDWLDPDNTGALVLDGKSCATSVVLSQTSAEVCNAQADSVVLTVTVAQGFGGNVTLTALNLPAGATASFTANPLVPGVATDLTIGNLGAVADGNYTLRIAGTDGSDTDTTNLSLSVTSGVPAAVVLDLPANAAVNVSTVPVLSWLPGTGTRFEVEIATDAAFTNVVATASGLTSPSYAGAQLTALTTYYWRVRAENACGPGTWSSAFEFTTAQVTCADVSAGNLPLNIGSQQPNTVTVRTNVTQDVLISQVEVLNVQGVHTWVGDLTFILRSPQGTQVVLVDQICDDEQDFNAGFSDFSLMTLPCPYTTGNTYLALGSLADFNGESSVGWWEMDVIDNAWQDGGTVQNLELRICGTPNAAAATAWPEQDLMLAPNPAQDRLALSLQQAPLTEGRVDLLGLSGQLIYTQTWAAGERAQSLDLTGMPAGMYLVRYESGGRSLVRKLVIAH